MIQLSDAVFLRSMTLLCLVVPLLVWNVEKLQAQNIMGGAVGDPSALLDMQSSDRGLLIPRMTSAQRSAIVSPAAGLMIYNTTLQCIELNSGSSTNPNWSCLRGVGECSALDCTAATLTDSLIAGYPARSVAVSIPYVGGNGGLINGQEVVSAGVTGLTASLSSEFFANGSGRLVYTITGTPSGSGTASFELAVGGQSCTLNVRVINRCGAYVSAGEWKEFQCHNLGANTAADPFSPSWELIGNYYQWGRNPACFGRDGTDGVNPCSSPVQGAAGPWGNTTSNDNAGLITGWDVSSAATDAWQDAVKTANDPCPAGFRVPTRNQWSGITNRGLNSRQYVGTWPSSSTNYSSGIKIGGALFLPATGFRSSSNGELFQRGLTGYYWSSSASPGPLFLVISSNQLSIASGPGFPTGSSLRCIAE